MFYGTTFFLLFDFNEKKVPDTSEKYIESMGENLFVNLQTQGHEGNEAI